MTQSIKIAGVEIRTDHEGRFCVNDLHRAAGAEKRHQPSNWLALQQTQALIEAIEQVALEACQEQGGVPTAPVKSRQNLGTFVAKELVYAYAMWVSPTFNLKVISAYDALQRAQAQTLELPDFNDPVTAARVWADEVEKVRNLAKTAQEQRERLEQARPAVEFHQAVASSEDSLTIAQFAKILGTGEVRFFERLRADEILMARPGSRYNLPYQRFLDAGYFKVIERTYTDLTTSRTHITFQTRITSKGQMWLQRRYLPHEPARQNALFSQGRLTYDAPAQSTAEARRPLRQAARLPAPDAASAPVDPFAGERLAHPDQDAEASRYAGSRLISRG